MRLGCAGGRLWGSWPVNMKETSALRMNGSWGFFVGFTVSRFGGAKWESWRWTKSIYILVWKSYVTSDLNLLLNWKCKSSNIDTLDRTAVLASANCFDSTAQICQMQLKKVLETVFMAAILRFPWSLMVFVPQVMFAQLMGAYPNVHLENLCYTSPGLRSLAGV